MGKPFHAMVQVVANALNAVEMRHDRSNYGEIARAIAQALCEPENRQVLRDFLYGLDGEALNIELVKQLTEKVADLERQNEIQQEQIARQNTIVHSLRMQVARMRLRRDGIGGLGE